MIEGGAKMFKNMTIQKTMTVVLGTIIAIAVLVGAVGIVGIFMVNQQVNTVSDNLLPSISALLTMEDAIKADVLAERGLINPLLEKDLELRKAQYPYIENALKRLNDAWAVYEKMPKSDTEVRLWAKFQKMYKEWRQYNQQVIDDSKEKDRMAGSGISYDSPEVLGSIITRNITGSARIY
jgi:hypothetical protein